MDSPGDEEGPARIGRQEREAIRADVRAKLDKLELEHAEHAALAELVALLDEYVENDERPAGKPLRGEIPYPEANRAIVYRLPCRSGEKARVLIEFRSFYQQQRPAA